MFWVSEFRVPHATAVGRPRRVPRRSWLGLLVSVLAVTTMCVAPAGAVDEPNPTLTSSALPSLAQFTTGQTDGDQPADQPAAAADQATAREFAKQSRCRNGWVSLTFDDGPDPVRTPRLVRILTKLDVPATFFMVGERVHASEATVRLVADHGFQIANHSYRHADMVGQTSPEVRTTLRNTQRALVHAGVRPTQLMRPPYGAINPRVERAIRAEGFQPVLWTVDSSDWAGGNSRQIADRILARLHPHGTNVVLQHDGVTNSPASIGAVTRVVEVARKRGYCFTDLTSRGTPNVPAPTARVISRRPGREGTAATVTVRLSHPAAGIASVRLRTQQIGALEAAAPGEAPAARADAADFPLLTRTLRFAPGETEKTLQLAVVPDEVPEPAEEFAVALDQARGLVLADQRVLVGILDARQPPSVAVAAAVVKEPARRPWALARVRVWLGRTSGHDVTVTLRSAPGTADARDFAARTRTVRIPAGATHAWATFPVARDHRHEGRERFSVTITGVTHARVAHERAWVTILP